MSKLKPLRAVRVGPAQRMNYLVRVAEAQISASYLWVKGFMNAGAITAVMNGNILIDHVPFPFGYQRTIANNKKIRNATGAK